MMTWCARIESANVQQQARGRHAGGERSSSSAFLHPMRVFDIVALYILYYICLALVFDDTSP